MVAPQWIHLVSAQVVTNWKHPVSGQRCRHGFLDMSKFGATGWSWQDWVRVEWVMVFPSSSIGCLLTKSFAHVVVVWDLVKAQPQRRVC